jgi:hypothetical protein
MLYAHRKLFTHAVTLTLKQAAWIETAKGRSYTRLTPLIAQKTLRHTLNRLNRCFWGNAARRKPNTHKLLVIASLEGQRSHKRLHYHLQIGNLPKHLTQTDLRDAITLAWTANDFGDTQINIQALYGSGWTTYITKEIGSKDTDCIDWENTHFVECGCAD